MMGDLFHLQPLGWKAKLAEAKFRPEAHSL